MATTTPNFGWDIPQSTDLVKDGATAIAALGTDIDTSLVDLKGGTTGQILSKNSNTDMDFTWITNDVGDITAVNAGTGISGGGSSGAVTITNDMATTITASGDIIVGTGSGSYDNLPIGTTGQVLTADTTVSPYKVKWATPSSGVTTWTQRKTPHGTAIRSIAYNGSNLYVAAGDSGKLFSSSDAQTWTERTSGFGSNRIRCVAFGNGLFVAVGDNGTITTSSDGTTWTARTANMSTNAINHVLYANSTWIAVGAGGGTSNTGGITYSTDGLTWTRKSQSITVGSSYYMVTYNGTNFVIGAGLSTNNFLYASSASGTWTASVDNVIQQNIYWMSYDGTRTIFGSQGQWAYSTSATLATQTIYSNAPSEIADGGFTSGRNFLYSGRIYVTSDYLQSFSTTPVNTDYPNDEDVPTILPTSRITATPSLTAGVSTIYVNASGTIIGGSTGRIYTTF